MAGVGKKKKIERPFFTSYCFLSLVTLEAPHVGG